MCCSFGSGAEQQKHHRHHLLLADTSAFLLDADKFCDQAFAASVACSLQAPLQVAFHRPNTCDQAEEANHAGEPSDAVHPGDETRPVGAWQTEQLADDRERQLPRIAFNQVGWVPVSEQLGRKLISNCKNSRLHVDDSTTPKSFVDNVAQTSMVWLVHGQ